MSKVLIISKTRMQDDRVCVGAIDLDNKRSIRLLNSNGFHETIHECPYELLTIWEIKYNKISKRSAPHLEDVAVLHRTNTHISVKLNELPKFHIYYYNLKLYSSSLLRTFDEKLSSTDGGSLYINNTKGVTKYSTCFWICDKDLKKNRFSTERKIKYDYQDDDGRYYHITYVGIENSPDIIKKGTLVRLSLAHWWHPENTDIEDRCYLQLSGFFDLGDLDYGPIIIRTLF